MSEVYQNVLKSLMNFFSGINIVNLLINIILIAIIIIGITTLLRNQYARMKEEKLKGTLKGKKRKNNGYFLQGVPFLRTFQERLIEYLKENDSEEKFNVYYYGVLGVLAISMVGMLLVGQFFLAFVFPIILIMYINRILVSLRKDKYEELEHELPTFIDNIIRGFSKQNDIKSVLYGATQTANEPLYSLFESVLRKMSSRSSMEVLEEESTKTNNIWFNSMLSTLISYLEDADKEYTIENLRHLRNMLEKENALKAKKISDKKYAVGVNYMLVVLGIVAFILNMLFNPIAIDFFFHSFTGLIVFAIGIGTSMFTIMMNIGMTRNKR